MELSSWPILGVGARRSNRDGQGASAEEEELDASGKGGSTERREEAGRGQSVAEGCLHS